MYFILDKLYNNLLYSFYFLLRWVWDGYREILYNK